MTEPNGTITLSEAAAAPEALAAWCLTEADLAHRAFSTSARLSERAVHAHREARFRATAAALASAYSLTLPEVASAPAPEPEPGVTYPREGT